MFCVHGVTVQVSTWPFNCAHCKDTFRKTKRSAAQVWGVRCAVRTQEAQQQSRRLVNFSFLALFHSLSVTKRTHLSPFNLLFPNLRLNCNSAPTLTADVIAGSMFDKYVKRKKLDPLEVYVPAIILTQLQIKDLEKTLGVEKPQYVACRSLLRSGPAASLRVNIRAVAQYAVEGGHSDSFTSVDKCLRALEELDSLLLRASRNDGKISIDTMRTNAGIALDALDSLLQTVPPEVRDKGRVIADAYRAPAEDVAPEKLDAEMEQLQSIL